MGDPDVTLFPSLLAGVCTGFGPAIPPSGTFPPKAAEPLPDTPLSVHLSNWQSAEQNLPLTRELVAKELSKGFIFKYPGTVEQAQQEFPMGVSVGKLGIATSDSRPSRLVVDSSICRLNSRCVIPEKEHPSFSQRAYQIFSIERLLTAALRLFTGYQEWR